MVDPVKPGELYNLGQLVEIGGNFSIGYIPPVEDAVLAIASAPREVLATLVAREGESFEQLLRRLDASVGEAMSTGISINEAKDRGIEFVVHRQCKRRKEGHGDAMRFFFEGHCPNWRFLRDGRSLSEARAISDG